MVSCRPNITTYVTTSDATWSICVLGTPVSCAKTDEPTEMQFAVENWRRALEECTRRKCTLAPPGEYNGLICAAAAMRFVATVTV